MKNQFCWIMIGVITHAVHPEKIIKASLDLGQSPP